MDLMQKRKLMFLERMKRKEERKRQEALTTNSSQPITIRNTPSTSQGKSPLLQNSKQSLSPIKKPCSSPKEQKVLHRNYSPSTTTLKEMSTSPKNRKRKRRKSPDYESNRETEALSEKNTAQRRLSKHRRLVDEKYKSTLLEPLKSDRNSSLFDAEDNDVLNLEPMDCAEEEAVTFINELRAEPTPCETEDSEWRKLLEKKKLANSAANFYAIVDTNIFISNLKSLMEVCCWPNNVVIVVPWMVLQELDRLKDRDKLKSNARIAINFIHKHLEDGRIEGQPLTVLWPDQTPDDSILFCCLHIQSRTSSFALFSNDINLRNKAIIHNIQAYDYKKLSELSGRPNFKPLQKVKDCVAEVCTKVLEGEMHKAYGDVWVKMAHMNPPWNLEQALKCFLHYWVAVFSFSLKTSTKVLIENLRLFFQKHESDFDLEENDWTTLLKYLFSFLAHLKANFDDYKDLCSDAIKNLQNIVDKK